MGRPRKTASKSAAGTGSSSSSNTAKSNAPPAKARSVDFLTPEQLRRKREGDRLSQKQARERTKLLITELQKKVQDLEAQKKGLVQALAAAEARAPQACAFCGHAVSVSADTAHTSNDTPEAEGVRPWVPGDGVHASLSRAGHESDVATLEMHDDSSGGGVPTIDNNDDDTQKHLDAALTQALMQMLDENHPVLGLYMCSETFDDKLPPTPLYQGLLEKPSLPAAAFSLGSGSDTSGMDLVVDGSSAASSSSSPPVPMSMAMAVPMTGPVALPASMPLDGDTAALYALARDRPVWSILPPHVSSTCPLDDVVLDLLQKRRPLERTGGNVQEFQRRAFPSIESLLNPVSDKVSSAPRHRGRSASGGSSGTTTTTTTDDDRNPVTSTIANGIVRVMTAPTLPEQLAILFMMGSVVRWLISPTAANYASMPPWLRPTAAQLVAPHPPWVDLFPWPRARARFSREAQYHGQHLLLSRVCNESLSVNWPHGTADMVQTNTANGSTEYVLSPQFERHIRNMDNWTLGRGFYQVFPGVANDVNIL